MHSRSYRTRRQHSKARLKHRPKHCPKSATSVVEQSLQPRSKRTPILQLECVVIGASVVQRRESRSKSWRSVEKGLLPEKSLPAWPKYVLKSLGGNRTTSPEQHSIDRSAALVDRREKAPTGLIRGLGRESEEGRSDIRDRYCGAKLGLQLN